MTRLPHGANVSLPNANPVRADEVRRLRSHPQLARLALRTRSVEDKSRDDHSACPVCPPSRRPDGYRRAACGGRLRVVPCNPCVRFGPASHGARPGPVRSEALRRSGRRLRRSLRSRAVRCLFSTTRRSASRSWATSTRLGRCSASTSPQIRTLWMPSRPVRASPASRPPSQPPPSARMHAKPPMPAPPTPPPMPLTPSSPEPLWPSRSTDSALGRPTRTPVAGRVVGRSARRRRTRRRSQGGPRPRRRSERRDAAGRRREDAAEATRGGVDASGAVGSFSRGKPVARATLQRRARRAARGSTSRQADQRRRPLRQGPGLRDRRRPVFRGGSLLAALSTWNFANETTPSSSLVLGVPRDLPDAPTSRPGERSQGRPEPTSFSPRGSSPRPPESGMPRRMPVVMPASARVTVAWRF